MCNSMENSFLRGALKKKNDYINFGGKKVKVDFKNCTDYIINILLQSIFYFEIVNY